MADPRYPIGPFKAHAKDRTTAEEKVALIDEIERRPGPATRGRGGTR